MKRILFAALAFAVAPSFSQASDTTTTGSSEAVEGSISSVTATVGASVSGSIANVVAARGAGSFSGPSAGSPGLSTSGGAGQASANPVGIWANFTTGWIGDDTFATESEGNIYVGTVGADYRVTNDILVGAAATIEGVSTDISPVIAPPLLAAEKASGEYEQFGVTISPYFAYQLTDILSLSGAAGYTFTQSDISTTKLMAGVISSRRPVPRIRLSISSPSAEISRCFT